MPSKLHNKLNRDIRFLDQNEVPMEPSGVRLEKLDYEGDSSDNEKQLEDGDVKLLADAFMKNDTFSGPLDLSKNKLTDLVSYNSNHNHFFVLFSHASTSTKLSLGREPPTSRSSCWARIKDSD